MRISKILRIVCANLTSEIAEITGLIAHGFDTALYTEVNFECSSNYTISDNSSITCLANGQWSAPLPNCTGILKKNLTYLLSKI